MNGRDLGSARVNRPDAADRRRGALARASRIAERRWAQLVLLGGLPFWYLGYRVDRNDWGYFILAARIMTGYVDRLGFHYEGDFHLYADFNLIQIGPPPVLAVSGAFAVLPHPWLRLIFSLLIYVLGFVAAITSTRWSSSARQRALIACLVLPMWAFYLAGRWMHLDDAMAISGTLLAMWLVHRDRALLAGLALGTAIASKPWAVVAVPVLLGLRGDQRAKAVLTTFLVGVAWWAPFLITDPRTIPSLGRFALPWQPGTVGFLFGLHGPAGSWLRPTQAALGLSLATAVAARRDWRLALLAGMVGRVLLDPFSWPYYGIGPLLAAAVADATGARRQPLWTVTTLATYYGPMWVLGVGSSGAAVGKVVWAALVIAALAASQRRPAVGAEATRVAAVEPALA